MAETARPWFFFVSCLDRYSPRVQKVEQQHVPPIRSRLSSIREEQFSIELPYIFTYSNTLSYHNNRIPDKKIGESKARYACSYLTLLRVYARSSIITKEHLERNSIPRLRFFIANFSNDTCILQRNIFKYTTIYVRSHTHAYTRRSRFSPPVQTNSLAPARLNGS